MISGRSSASLVSARNLMLGVAPLFIFFAFTWKFFQVKRPDDAQPHKVVLPFLLSRLARDRTTLSLGQVVICQSSGWLATFVDASQSILFDLFRTDSTSHDEVWALISNNKAVGNFLTFRSTDMEPSK